MALDVIASGTSTLIVKDIFDTFAAFASGTAPGSGTWSLSLITSSTGSSVSLPPIQTIWVRDTISATPSGSIFGDRQYGRAVAGAKFTRAGRHWRKSWRGGVLAEKAVGYDRDLSPFAALACRWLGNSPMVFRKHYLQVSPDVIERATGRTRNVRDEREDGEGGQSARMPDQPSPPHNGPLGEKLGDAHAGAGQREQAGRNPAGAFSTGNTAPCHNPPRCAPPSETLKVPERGLEPPPSYLDKNLNLARLPIPPLGRVDH